MPGGRPSAYSTDYVDQVREHLGKGFTLASFGGSVGASRQTLYNWADAHEEFLDAIKVGRAKGQALWEERLATQAIDGSGNTAAIIFAMKNLYQDDWADRIVNEHTGANGGPIETKELSQNDLGRRIAFALAQAVKNGSPGSSDGA